MTSVIPITLRGKHLGERHHYLNTFVGDAYRTNEPLDTILSSPESGPVDRFFKIELASKYRNVDYILNNLRDDDMLYVSRSLKSKWLLEDAYRHIINPNYLENDLYPNMITPAVNKTKHWIHLNLRDPIRCVEFYEFYCDKDSNIAIKFLPKCPVDIIEKECLKWFDEMTPEYFKILCERSATVAKIFFESTKEKKALRKKYFKYKDKYIKGLQCILKADIDIYLDIVEKFELELPYVSPNATKFIMKQRKDRFLKKSELYAANILHMGTLAQCLSPEECEDFVLKLARAKFINDIFYNWFNYKNVEPLIKRIDITKRYAFRKRVFVQKDVGMEVDKWPYPITEESSDSDEEATFDVFEDIETEPYMPYGLRDRFLKYERQSLGAYRKRKKKTAPESFLDLLFDEYRFMGFEETLAELWKKIAAESLPKNRMPMFLVLVSKSGGKVESLKKLIELMMLHRNEPAHVRSAVVRSLVKRASIWRATDDIWKSFLVFAEGLGLDGVKSDCECIEGLNAVIIRNFLSNNEITSAVKTAFLNDFSTMTRYPLTPAEKDIVCHNLVKLLMDSARDAAEPHEESHFLMHLLDTIRDYKLHIDLDLIMTIKALAVKDKDAAKSILHRLFKSNICRKELFRENFGLIQTADSYMNALKHDTDVLVAEDFVNLVKLKGLDARHFLRKINIYFTDNESLRNRFLIAIKGVKMDKNTCKSVLARAIVYLIGSDLKSYMVQIDTEDSKESKLFAAQVRGHAHVARPALTVDSTEWRQFGVKHVANRVLVCRQADIDNVIKQLLMWKRTAKLAITLSKRTDYVTETLAAVAKIRPTVALKSGLQYIRQQGDKYDPRAWETIKPLMIEVSKKSFESSKCLIIYFNDINDTPTQMKPEFVTLAFTIINKFHEGSASVVLLLYQINKLLAYIDEDLVENILLNYLERELVLEKMQNTKVDRLYDSKTSMHLRLLGKYLLLCKTKENQDRRFEKVGLLYLNRLESCWKSKQHKKIVLTYIDQILNALKYTQVFLNNEYVDCLPVMGKIATWMQSMLPMEQHFNLFVDLHLTMSYCRAIRQSVKQAPEVFADKEARLTEGVKIVGEIFGKYISHEAHELRLKYFDSIIELYSKHLNQYLSHYFNRGICKMEPYIIRSLLKSVHEEECYLAFVLYNRCKIYEIRDIIKQRNDVPSQFLCHCGMFIH